MQSETFVIQCENSLAGALLIEPYEVVQAVRPLVSESDFLTDQARAIYKATVELVNSGKPCDVRDVPSTVEEIETVACLMRTECLHS